VTGFTPQPARPLASSFEAGFSPTFNCENGCLVTWYRNSQNGPARVASRCRYSPTFGRDILVVFTLQVVSGGATQTLEEVIDELTVGQLVYATIGIRKLIA